MQKWEFSVLGPIYNIVGPAKWNGQRNISYYPTQLTFGVDKGERSFIYEMEGNQDGNLVRLIAEMGLNGWEMVGTGPVELPAERNLFGEPTKITPTMHLLYFKRPIED